MRYLVTLALSALLLSGCANPAPKSVSGSAVESATQDDWQAAPDSSIVAPTLEQCLAFIETGTHDAAALQAVGYAPYTPLLKPSGYQAVPRVLTYGPFNVEHEREVRVFFEGSSALGRRAGCRITSEDKLDILAFKTFFESRGFDAQVLRKGRYSFTKGDTTLSMTALRNVNLSAGALFNFTEYTLRRGT